MTLGALVDAGADASELTGRLALLGVDGYEISFEKVDRSGISATRALVRLTREEKQHRHLSQIEKIIGGSRLNDSVKGRALKKFRRLGEAEARVHGVPVERIHFHEVGAVDAIVDVVGACICFELLGVERFAASALHVGSGTVEMAHGRFPVPPPAVAELLSGAPVYSTDIVGELVTPTGAAIVATVCEEFGPLPRMRVGESETEAETPPAVSPKGVEELLMVETNVDDVSPQVLGHLMERALEAGALDCFFTHVQMKKNRPGVLVSILCRPSDGGAMHELIFAETTTLGVRSYAVRRRALEREFVTVETEFGTIAVKVARWRGRVVGATPEYEDCRAAARSHNVPLRVV